MKLISKIFFSLFSLMLTNISVKAITNETIINKIDNRISEISEVFQRHGVEDTFARLNGTRNSRISNSDNNEQKSFISSNPASEGENVICVQDSKQEVIIGDTDPTQIGKDVTNDPLIPKIIKKLQSNPADEKVTVTFKDLKGQEKFARVWGRKALLGDKLDKSTTKKFFCYIPSISMIQSAVKPSRAE